MELDERLEQVDGPKTFVTFVRQLIADRKEDVSQRADTFGRGVHGWENDSIEDFLEAGLAWAEDSNFGVKQGLERESPWKQFASFLYCGKIYELHHAILRVVPETTNGSVFCDVIAQRLHIMASVLINDDESGLKVDASVGGRIWLWYDLNTAFERRNDA